MSLWLIFELSGFLAGLLFGSFLNVCIARLPRGQSILKPASHCPFCKHPIRWRDNIPILSWILLRERCRDCHRQIPFVYPAVELVTALWFALSAKRLYEDYWTFVLNPDGAHSGEAFLTHLLAQLAIAILGFLLIGLLVMDWQTQRLPDAFTLTGIAIALFLVCTQAIFLGPTEDQVLLRHKAPITAAMSVEKGNVFLTGPEALIGGRILAILAAAGLLLGVRALYRLVRDREGMGLGDVKLLALIAAFLGFLPALLALFAGVLAATAYAVVLLATRRAHPTTPLPFGTFLAGGGLLSALFAPTLIQSYTSLFR